MDPKATLFDALGPAQEAAADARAEADVAAGRLISHDAVKRWTASWGSDAPIIPLSDPRLDTDGSVEHGYGVWKHAKIECGLAQANDRSTMIKVEQILADLKLGS